MLDRLGFNRELLIPAQRTAREIEVSKRQEVYNNKYNEWIERYRAGELQNPTGFNIEYWLQSAVQDPNLPSLFKALHILKKMNKIDNENFIELWKGVIKLPPVSGLPTSYGSVLASLGLKSSSSNESDPVTVLRLRGNISQAIDVKSQFFGLKKVHTPSWELENQDIEYNVEKINLAHPNSDGKGASQILGQLQQEGTPFQVRMIPWQDGTQAPQISVLACDTNRYTYNRLVVGNELKLRTQGSFVGNMNLLSDMVTHLELAGLTHEKIAVNYQAQVNHVTTTLQQM